MKIGNVRCTGAGDVGKVCMHVQSFFGITRDSSLKYAEHINGITATALRRVGLMFASVQSLFLTIYAKDCLLDEEAKDKV